MKKYLILFILFIVIISNPEKVSSKTNEILAYNFDIGYHSFDLSELNKTLKDASFPKLKDYSFLMGIGFSSNYLVSYRDTSLLDERPEIFKNIYFSLNYYFNVKTPPIDNTVYNSNKGGSFNYNIVSFDFVYPIEIFKFLSLHPSFGLSYNWGTLTLADSIIYYPNFQDYLSHTPIFNEFSLDRLSFNLGLGLYLNYFTQEEKQVDKKIIHIDKIGLFAHYFIPLGDGSSILDERNNFQNSIRKPVPGLGTTFPRGFVLELRITYDKATTY